MKVYLRLVLMFVTMLLATSAMAQLQFADGVIYSALSSPQDSQAPFYVKVGDLDDDGKNDVVTGNYFGGNVTVFYGNGDGTLQTPSQYPTVPQGYPGSAFGVEICDVNHDGLKDIIATNTSHPAYGLAILINQGGRVFTLNQTLTTDVGPGNVVVGDFNGDKQPDIAIPCYTAHNTPGHVRIYLNNGNGSFQPVAPTPADLTVTPSFTAAGDFHGDGRVDLAVSGWFSNPSVMTILRGDGAGHFAPTWVSPHTGMEPDGSFVGDVNEDGKLDIIQVIRTTNQLIIHRGNGDGTFSYATPVSLTVGDYPIQPVLADFNGDGHLDIACTSSSGQAGPRSIMLFQGDGTGQFGQGPNSTPNLIKTLPFSNQGLAAADMNGDGRLDLLAGSWDRGIIVFLNTGSYSLPSLMVTTSPLPNNWGWNNTNVQVAFSALGHPNTTMVTYSVDGGPAETGKLSTLTIPPITAEGTHSITAFFTDSAGYPSPTVVTTVKIDKMAPSTTASVTGGQLTLTATDALSGIDQTYFTVDGGAQQTYTGPITLPSTGAHSVTFWSVDKAGNVETAQTLTGIGTPTYTTVTNVTGMVGQKKTLSARLRKTGSNVALAGQTLTFKVDGTVVGSDVTNASGVATLIYTLPETIATQTIEASFAGDAANDPSTGVGTLSIVFANTVIAVTDKTTQAGASTSLIASLKRVGDGAIAGKDLTFKLDGTLVGTATTNVNGVATLAITAPSEVGSKTITVEYAGNAVYGASSGTGTLTLVGDTFVTVTDVTGMAGERKTLVARLRGVGNNLGIGGKTLTFKVDGVVVGTDVTSASGVASIVYTLPEELGSKTITVEFAGDGLNSASTGSGTLTITFANTVITVANKSLAAGDTGTLSATLKRVGDGGIAGQLLTFKVDGAVVGTGTTNTAGIASVSYTAPLEVGSKTITVEYAGTAVYGSSVGTGTLTLVKSATTLVLTNRVVRVNHATLVTARLRRVSDGAFVSGASVVLSVNGIELGTFTTDANGYVSVPYTPLLTGVFSLSASFVGDRVHLASSDTGTLTVNP